MVHLETSPGGQDAAIEVRYSLRIPHPADKSKYFRKNFAGFSL
jgi:hypothetical protein